MLEQTDGLDPDTRMMTIVEQLSQVQGGALDRARWQVVSEKDLYLPPSKEEALVIARQGQHQCMFDTGLWLTVQAMGQFNTIDEQVVEYWRRGGTFIYPTSRWAVADAMQRSPKEFSNWLRQQTDLTPDEKTVMDRLYTNAYIRKHIGTSR